MRRCGRAAGGAGPRVLASVQRRDREVRCDAGAAPATVCGEIATEATGRGRPGWEGAAIDDPEPGDLLVAPLSPTILGWRSVLPDRLEASPRSSAAASLPPLTLVLGGARSGKSRYAE